jgi:hypothetical protein
MDSTQQAPLRLLPVSSQPITAEQAQAHLSAFLEGFRERRNGDMEVGLVERLTGGLDKKA